METNLVSDVLSYLGRLFLDGNAEVARFLYKNIWKESPPLLRTIGELQERLTTVEVEDDTTSVYSTEFLYFWGMTCLGEQSPLIIKDLGTAEACFRRIKDRVPLAEPRLAFLKLLQSNEPAKSDNNVVRIETLRRWANKRDLFSRIALAKICFFSSLEETQTDTPGLPIRALNLLELPRREGHPVAIRFWNEMLGFIGTPEAISMQESESRIRSDSLYDFSEAQRCK